MRSVASSRKTLPTAALERTPSKQRSAKLGGFPAVIGPLLGRAAAALKALTEQAQPFGEALLGDLALEHQLLDRARYIKALAVAVGSSDVEKLADRSDRGAFSDGRLAHHCAGRRRARWPGRAATHPLTGRHRRGGENG